METNFPSRKPAWPLTLTFAAALAACSGDDGSSSATAPPVAPTTVAVSGTVADGPLQGASVCYDLNDNGVCDSDEPSASTDASGAYSLDVGTADAGAHRVVVQVPATAIDKDTGKAVGAAFVLIAPASGGSGAQTVFVSPLTTLVQTQIDASGQSLADASKFVQAQAGLTGSPTDDFTSATTDAAKQAAGIARVLGAALREQGGGAAGAVGQTDVSGAKVTQTELDAAVRKALLGMLPALAAAAADPTIAAADDAGRQAAIDAVAQTIVAAQGLSEAGALFAVGVANLPPETASTSTPAAGATLRALAYDDANDWYYRAMEATAADNTPDANGDLRYYDYHSQDIAGTPSIWGTGSTPDRAGDQHWDGTKWVACPLGTLSVNTARDAQGRSNYNYCDTLEEGITVRSGVDISGKTLTSVLQTIRAFPGGDSGVAFADWGPTDTSVLGTATFPTGSTLYYYTTTPMETAFGYDVRSTNAVEALVADVAAGGDARNGATPACSAVTPSNVANYLTPVTSLDDLVARNPGKPCIFNQSTNSTGTSLNPNEWWTNSTASLGIVDGAVTPPTSYYTDNLSLQVSFAASGSGATYYNCYQRASDGNTGRNCTVAGTGTYAIQKLADARVMTFTGLPAAMQRAGYSRVFVERGGAVYYGYQSVTGTTTDTVRLNLTAANALLAKLALPALAPTASP